jgi:hypothetical protein
MCLSCGNMFGACKIKSHHCSEKKSASFKLEWFKDKKTKT